MTAIAQARNSYMNEDLYATDKDFCEIFKAEMTGFYSLALLLTGSRASAQQCFVAGLKESVCSHGVFKELAYSWSRRSIIKHAIHIVHPLPGALESRPEAAPNVLKGAPEFHFSVAAIMGLEPFDRFVFVMSVLEGYSAQDCATLLNSMRQDVISGRTRALQQLTSSEAGGSPAVELEAKVFGAQDALPLTGAA